jgi:pimeloyl-ACP methyl ester carboxylesterase
MPTAVVEGRTIAWREAGHGAPALLLHCSLAHAGAFAPLMARLDGLAMRALDLPGHGGTGWDPSVGIQDQAVANARALLDAPAHLIGHSFGATVALRLGLEAPERVASLTLIEPVQYSLVPPDAEPLRAERAAMAAVAAVGAAGDWHGAAVRFLGRWGGAGGLGAMTAAQAAYAVERMPIVLAAHDDLFGGLTAAALPPAAPLLLVEGAASPPVVAAVAGVIRAAAPEVQRVVVAGAGHMVPITHPEPVSRAIGRFLALQDA